MHFILSMEENHLYDVLDAKVINQGKKEEIVTIANIAKRCLNLSGKNRPSMIEVAMELEGIRASRKDIDFQQHYQEVEYVRSEVTEPWDVVSTSTSSTCDSIAPSVDIQPLLIN
ncbi:hypothetical protein Pint_07543 [Pistacia integerrima]|uniref:Uncharacterized protein n=1 Tax=Pistacia integerrima TaxID=434235 RepID=A0ACC0Y000_9ROSI|nr:hypothetical protein Pint_07543 [Pistacia integerrima]